MRAVCPICCSTCWALVTPGMETEIWFFPVVCTSAPDTPSPLTRRFRMLTVSFRSAWRDVVALGGVDDRDAAGQVETEARATTWRRTRRRTNRGRSPRRPAR